MFKELQPLIAERDLILRVKAAADGRLMLYIEPVALKGEDDEVKAVTTLPFCVNATADELDADLAAVLAEWVASRSVTVKGLNDVLVDLKSKTEAASAAAKKAAAEKAAKKTSPTTIKTASTVTKAASAPGTASAPIPPVSDDDDNDDDEGNEGGGTPPLSATPAKAPEPAPAAKVEISVPTTESLFD